MPHDVFISYASADKQAADAVYAALRSAGIEPWMAPNDIAPGAAYGGAICDAIEASKLVVLIFSPRSNASKMVARELYRAADKDIPVIAFRIEEAPLSGDLKFLISHQQWLDALTQPLDAHFERLIQAVDGWVGPRTPRKRRERSATPGLTSDTANQPPKHKNLDESIGIEIQGGVFHPIFARGIDVPASAEQQFATAADNQTVFTITLLAGNTTRAAEARVLGRFDFTGITPAPRGVSKISLTFKVDGAGTVAITAKHDTTGSEKSMVMGQVGLRDQRAEQSTLEVDDLFRSLMYGFGATVSPAAKLVRGEIVLNESVGLETLGGVFSPVLERGVELPSSSAQVFTTAEDNQKAVVVTVLAGNTTRAAEARVVGRFEFGNITLAPRGVPQISVTFNVESDGAVRVSAREEGTSHTKSLMMDKVSVCNRKDFKAKPSA